MANVFFTADNHFGHANVIRFQNRPFASVDEMDEAMVAKWNSKVKACDRVYVIGDLLYRSQNAPDILRRLKGKKHLIVGNHDGSWMRQVDLSDYFESVDKYLEVSDGLHGLLLCHYPLLCWPHEKRTYMVHGHIHDDTSFDFWPMIAKRDRLLNAGADINGYEPVTFDELVENNRRFKAAHTDCQPHAYPCVKE